MLLRYQFKGEKMNQELQTQDKSLIDLQTTQKICQQLMQMPHYKKMGAEGVMAIVETAKSIGVSPLKALNGGMYFVQGKVEMSSVMMNELIRAQGHSITKDRKSDATICILHGKRRDNGDTWTESFSIEDAKLANIYRNQWLKYPKDMLFARALSRLARQLFPDVIKGCYVQGEISDAQNLQDQDVEEKPPEPISEQQYLEIEGYLSKNEALKENILGYMKDKWNIEDLKQMPLEIYEQALTSAKNLHKEEVEEVCA